MGLDNQCRARSDAAKFWLLVVNLVIIVCFPALLVCVGFITCCYAVEGGVKEQRSGFEPVVQQGWFDVFGRLMKGEVSVFMFFLRCCFASVRCLLMWVCFRLATW